MKRIKTNFLMIAAAATGVVTLGSVAVAHAATTNPTSRVAHYTMSQTRLNAEAEVLGTTPTNLESTLKTETMKQLLASKNVTPKTFRQEVKAQVTKDLESQGYTQAQITASHAHHKHAKKSN